jgi:hypothetical protein
VLKHTWCRDKSVMCTVKSLPYISKVHLDSIILVGGYAEFNSTLKIIDFASKLRVSNTRSTAYLKGDRQTLSSRRTKEYGYVVLPSRSASTPATAQMASVGPWWVTVVRVD